jgi:prevent-host-death family protein
MRISVLEAEGQLADLVRRAEAGDDVVLTTEGQSAVRLVPITEERKTSDAELRAFLDQMAAKPRPATEEAARSQDFLYDEGGLPG